MDFSFRHWVVFAYNTCPPFSSIKPQSGLFLLLTPSLELVLLHTDWYCHFFPSILLSKQESNAKKRQHVIHLMMDLFTCQLGLPFLVWHNLASSINALFHVNLTFPILVDIVQHGLATCCFHVNLTSLVLIWHSVVWSINTLFSSQLDFSSSDLTWFGASISALFSLPTCHRNRRLRWQMLED